MTMRMQAERYRNAVLAMVLAGGILGWSTAATAKAASSTPDFEWSEVLAAGKTVTIKGVSGSVEASLASGKEAVVTARKHGERSDPDEVRIEVVRTAEGVTICAVYPSSSDEENSCEGGKGWSSHTHNNDVAVEFKVRVPAGVGLVARNVNGDLEVRGLNGPVDLETVNGSVLLETTDYGMASTVNGGITAVLGRSTWPEPLEFRTVNGSIDVTLPAKVSTKVSGSTMNGHIESDFPITVKGRINNRKMTGTIGAGASDMECESVNGSIRLRAAK